MPISECPLSEVLLYYSVWQGERLCGLSPLEVNISYSTDQFLLVSGLERETESFFSQLTLTTVDGYTFLFAGNGDGEIYQVRIGLKRNSPGKKGVKEKFSKKRG